jgi:hypothetical protein
MLPYPASQRFRRKADLVGDRRDRGPLSIMLAGRLLDHAHGALNYFRGKTYRFLVHRLLSLKDWSRPDFRSDSIS